MTAPAWFPDESVHAGEEHLDADYVGMYDRKAGFDPDPDVEELVARGPLDDATVVDLGCGTGTFALAIAPRCARVVAVDVSPAMIAAVQTRVAEAGATNVEVVRGGFLTYDHRGSPADVVYTRNALHQLPDLWKAVALRRIAAMLRPGGLLHLRDVMFSFDSDELEQHIEPWLANAADDPASGWTRAEYEMHLRTEHSTFAWLLEPMLEKAGFRVLDVAHRDSRVYSRYLCARSA